MTDKPPRDPTQIALDNLRVQNPYRKPMKVDPGCYDLAVKFLKSDKWTDEDKTELAEAIQEMVEDFISAYGESEESA